MPAPDPKGVHLEEYDDGTFRSWAEIWQHGNRQHRMARLKAIDRNMRRNGWSCEWCGGPVALYRRADARFCGASCKKKAARRR